MGKVVYSLNVSLDGFVQTADHSIDWVHIDEEIHRAFNAQQATVGAHLYGRRMWDVMASYWPTADQDPNATPVEVEWALIWQAMPKFVVSRSLDRIDEPNTQLVRGDAAHELERLRATIDGDIDVGGPTLAASLIERDLVDDFRLFLNPVTLGAGTPYLPAGMQRQMRLVETRPFASGVVYLRYERVR